MVGSLSCDVISQDQVIYSLRNQSCYGGYVKNALFKEYKKHIVKLYVSGGNVIRSQNGEVGYNGKSILNFTNGETAVYRLDYDSNLYYLQLFQNQMFNYDIEQVEEPLEEAIKKFKSGGDSGMGVLDSKMAKYIVVTIDLSQFDSMVQAKDALFFIRNATYSYNTPAISLMKYLKDSLLTDEDPFLLYSFSEVLFRLNKFSGTRGEYQFFHRGIGDDNRFLKYQSTKDFWKKLGTYTGTSVDPSHSDNFLTIDANYVRNINEILQNILLAFKHKLDIQDNFRKKLIRLFAEYHINFKDVPSVVKQELISKYSI